MKYIKSIKTLSLVFLVTVLMVAVVSVFGQDSSNETVDVSVITALALSIVGAVGSYAVSIFRRLFNVSGTAVFFVYLGVSVAIAVGVTAYYGAFDLKNIGATFSIVFAVGQAVYQVLIKEKPQEDEEDEEDEEDDIELIK